MKDYIDMLIPLPLFRGIDREKLGSILSCMDVKTNKLKKGEYVIHAGDKVEALGIVLGGTLHICKEDIDGNRVMIAGLEPGDMFAEALCCADLDESPFNVVCETDSTVMLLRFKRVMTVCKNTCPHHQKIIENMMYVLAQKNLMLQQRMDIISKRTLRVKILSYLETFKETQGRYITIPFNRNELADYLCVDRSALSHELSRMKKDDIIDYSKSHFKIL